MFVLSMRFNEQIENTMKLRKIGILALQASTSLRNRISEMEGKTPQTINRWVRDNDSNLTKAAIINAIKEVTGLTEDQLLEEAVAEAK